MTDEDRIKKLISCDAYKKLIDMIGGLNVISECGMEMQETKHSGLLARLLDPKSALCAKSGITNKFAKMFLTDVCTTLEFIDKRYCDDAFIDDIRVQTEWIFPNNKRVDIVLYSPATDLVIFIENKVLAGERDYDYNDPTDHNSGKGQLKDYIDGFESDWRFSKKYKTRDSNGNYVNALFLFLTPDEKPSTNKAWQAIGYIYVLEALKSIVSSITDIKVLSWIKDYIKFIRRNIVSDQDLKDILREIYRDEDNRIAIKKLVDEKLNIKKVIATAIYDTLVKKKKEWNLEDITSPERKTLIVTFKTKKSKQINPGIEYHAENESAIEDIMSPKSKFVGWSRLEFDKQKSKEENVKEVQRLRKIYGNISKDGTISTRGDRILPQNGIEVLVKDIYDEVNGTPKGQAIEDWLQHYINIIKEKESAI